MSERERPSSPSFSEFAELDSEIQRMSLHADALLDSIREVSGPNPHAPTQKQTSKTNSATVRFTRSRDNDEDDDMSEEEDRLDTIAANLRESLAAPPTAPPPSLKGPYAVAEESSTGVIIEEEEVTVIKSTEPLNEVVILSCTLVWLVVILLFVHAKFYSLLDERGYMRLPFGLSSDVLPLTS